MGKDLLLRNMIAAAPDVAALGAACRKAASALGFEHFLYGLRVAASLSIPSQFILSGYPKAWRTHYDERGFMATDPVLARGAVSVLPFGWDELDRDTAESRSLFADAARFGLCHGLTVPIHCLNGEFGVMSLARSTALPEADARAHLFQRAHWLSANVHERMRQLVVMVAEPAREPRLTPRERECLGWAALGLSAVAIAERISISESTVVYHLNGAERKLGVRTRGHAIARAVALGVIEPEDLPARMSAGRLIELAV